MILVIMKRYEYYQRQTPLYGMGCWWILEMASIKKFKSVLKDHCFKLFSLINNS